MVNESETSVFSKSNSDYILYLAVLLLVVINCIPICLALPEIIRKGMQIIAIFIFVIGLLLYKNKSIFFRYALLVIIHSLLIYAGWHEKKSFMTIIFNISACWGYYFYGYVSNKQKSLYPEKLTRIILFIFIISSITTIIGVQKYPLAVRELGRSEMSYSGLMGQDFIDLKKTYKMANIMSWSQVYGLVFIIPFFLALYKEFGKRRYLLFLFVCELCIVRSQVTFAILLSFLAIFLTFYFPRKNIKGYLSGFTLFIACSIVAINIKTIVYKFSVFFQEKGYHMISIKLYDLYLLTQGASQGDVSSRSALYHKSLQYFFENPILGAIGRGGTESISLSQHSDFLDMLGSCGFLFLLIFLFLLGKYLKNINKFSEYTSRYCKVLLFVFFVLFVFNPVWYSPQIYIGAFLLPQIYNQLSNKDVVKN